MKNTFIWKNNRPWPNPRLKTASIVGHTTHNSSKIWLRTARLGSFTLIIFEINQKNTNLREHFYRPDFSPEQLPQEVQKIAFTINNYNHDTTHVAEITGLNPFSCYGYALYGTDGSNDRIILGETKHYSFRTLHQKSTKPFSFAFLSCHMPYKDEFLGHTSINNMQMWSHLGTILKKRKEEMRFVINGGDQVYTDGVNGLNIWKYLAKVASSHDGVITPSQASMESWYRDIYRGYWGFENIKKIFAAYPQYMIWDDHELKDGWGSYYLKKNKDELDEIFDWESADITRQEAIILLDRMKSAAMNVYHEYQHSHNPTTPKETYDYHFDTQGATFYVLDGRGKRDINKHSRKVLGSTQLARFKHYVENLDPETTPFLFVTSAIPIIHLKSVLANADDNIIADMQDMQDDLRDTWEHRSHDSERKALLKILFAAAARGIRVSVLSGDVHCAAAFKLVDEHTGATIYQLTSSGISYTQSRLTGWILSQSTANRGHTDDGYHFERLFLYTQNNFSFIRVCPETKKVWFELYGNQNIPHPSNPNQDQHVLNAIANLELF